MLEIILVAAILVIDQIVKYLVDSNMQIGESIPLINGVFQITNVHNTGAAWGMLKNGRLLFLFLTPILCAALIYMLVRYRKTMHVIGRISLALLLAGALGNFIDRLVISYVRDMFDFCLINFPVFNVADSAITIGAVLLLYDTLFHKEDSVFSQLETKKAVSDGSKAEAETALEDAEALKAEAADAAEEKAAVEKDETDGTAGNEPVADTNAKDETKAEPAEDQNA